ncbi:MAG: hypothetical protein KA536_15540 [Saprospiraceae bacterium]|nr:hypothetical protein [Saprospiraceae bacterium]
MKKYKPTKIDVLLYKLYRAVDKNKKIIISTCFAFLGGMIINTLSNPDISSTLKSTYQNIFSVNNRPFNWLSWIALIIVVLTPFLSMVLKFHHRTRGVLSLVKKLIETNVSRSIREFSNGNIAWGTSLTIQQTPYLQEGWKLSDITINLDTRYFSMPPKYRQDFDKYLELYKKEKGFENDGEKYCVVKNPSSFTDAPTLTLELIKCKYSEIQYYKDILSTQTNIKNKFLRHVYQNNKITFPHALCLHMILVTSDSKILFVKRSNKTRYYQNKWSVSSEEQIHPKDFSIPNTHVLKHCLDRLLKEEIGVLNNIYEIDNFRILSVFIETDILNVSLAGIVKLNIDSKDLQTSINVIAKNDYEFQKFKLLDYKEIQKELMSPTMEYHGSAEYRILLALYHKYGPIELINMLME